MVHISVVIPCYNEQDNIKILWKRLKELNSKMIDAYGAEMDYIFVDDGSVDKTLEMIKSISAEWDNVSYISFSKNFGKEAAIYAGLKEADGDYAALIDADLQDPPELLYDMYAMITNEPYDCIATRRVDRKGEPPIRSFFAKKFYKIINKISGMRIVDGARDFRLMTNQMRSSVVSLGEKNRFSKGIFTWIGFNTKWIEYENAKREEGRSKWSFFSLVQYAIDGIVAFSAVPLAFSAMMGILFCVLAFLFIVVIIVQTLLVGNDVTGWPSLVCIILFVSGVQLFCTGILGIYISKIYSETKSRPIYIAKERIIKHKED